MGNKGRIMSGLKKEINHLFTLISDDYLEKNHIKAIIFDCFGTLVEIKDKTNPYKYLLSEIKNQNLTSEGLNFLKDYKNWVMTRKFTLSELEDKIGISLDIETKEIFKRLLNKEIDSIEFYSDTISVIKWLISNDIKLLLCSNLAYQYAEQINLLFAMSGLDKVKLVFSSNVGYIKPQIGMYQKCEELLEEKKSKILFVGDSYKNDYYEPLEYGYKATWLNRE